MRKESEYALYKGDEFITIGTQSEIAQYLGVKKNTVYFYSTPTYLRRCTGDANRLITVRLDDPDN